MYWLILDPDQASICRIYQPPSRYRGQAPDRLAAK